MKVVMLGAGFSRAISREMPLMSQLGPLVLERLRLPADTPAPFGQPVVIALNRTPRDPTMLTRLRMTERSAE